MGWATQVSLLKIFKKFILNSTSSLEHDFFLTHSRDWQIREKKIQFSLPQVANMYVFVLVPLGDREDGGISAADYTSA